MPCWVVRVPVYYLTDLCFRATSTCANESHGYPGDLSVG